MCVALAEADVIGATRIIEGKMGFLHAYSPNEDMDLNRLVAGLGKEWHFTATALKPYPACRMTHGVIEAAGKLGRKYGSEEKVKKIEIRLRTANMSLVGEPTRNKIHPEREVDAQFSAYFQCAHAWIYGSDEGVKAYTRLEDKEIYSLCDKIQCTTDDEHPATQQMGSVLSVEIENGEVEVVEMPFPLGEVEHPFVREQVEKKFRSCVATVWDEKKQQQIIQAIDGVCQGGKGAVKELMALVA